MGVEHVVECRHVIGMELGKGWPLYATIYLHALLKCQQKSRGGHCFLYSPCTVPAGSVRCTADMVHDVVNDSQVQV